MKLDEGRRASVKKKHLRRLNTRHQRRKAGMKEEEK